MANEFETAVGRRNAILALLILDLVWGYNWVVMKVALRYAAPFDFAALRASAGAVALLLLLITTRGPLRPRHLKLTILLGLLQTTGFVGLVSLALVSGEAGKSAVLVYTMPFWVVLLAPFFLPERIGVRQWTAVSMSMAGLLLMLEPWRVKTDLWSGLMAVLAGLSWGVAVIVAKKIPIRRRRELITLAAWQMAFGALPLLFLAFWIPAPPVRWTWPFIGALAFNTLPANAITWLLWLYILHKLPANITGISTLAVPVIGVLSAWLQLGERPAGMEWAGIVILLAALAVLISGTTTSPSRNV